MNSKLSKAKCVFLIKRNGKPYRYMTRVIIKGQKFYLGCYKTEAEASKAYSEFMEYCDKYAVSSLL
jgi:hypothetical protein